MQMRRRLGVNRQIVRAGLREAVEVALGLDDHEMHIERELRQLPDRLDYLGAKGEVRDEPAIHHVDVNPVGAAGLEARDVVREMPEVGAEDRRRDAAAHGAFGVVATRSRTVTPGGAGSFPVGS